jgi:hypothetical protein
VSWAYNKQVELDRAPFQRAPILDRAPANPARTAGIIILVGTSCALVRVLLPWVEQAAFGVSVTRTQFEPAELLLVALAVISAVTAGFVLVRRPAPLSVALVLVLMACVQVGLAIWSAATIMQGIQHESGRVLANSIGTGVYLGLLGSGITLAGSIGAWLKKKPSLPR